MGEKGVEGLRLREVGAVKEKVASFEFQQLNSMAHGPKFDGSCLHLCS